MGVYRRSMSNMGILNMIGLTGSLVFAIPVGVFGLNQLLAGEILLGGGLVVVAVAMVLLPQKLTTPTDIPEELAGTAIGKAIKTPDEDEKQSQSRDRE